MTVDDNDNGDGTRRPTLAEDARAAARARIVTATREVLAQKGFGMTIDDVVAASGVARRTVFRHFGTHGALISAALEDGWQIYLTLAPQPPPPGTDLHTWLVETLTRFHDFHARVLGQAFWGLHTGRTGNGSDAEVAGWHGRFVLRRAELSAEVAATAWQVAGGGGEPPGWVVDAFALHMSAFASHGLALGGLQSAAQTAAVSARILEAVLREALEEAA